MALADPMEAWKARGQELNAIYDVLRPAVHDEESTGDAVADLKALVAQRDRLQEERDRFKASLERYGRHDSGCEAGAPFFPARCVCGLHKALAWFAPEFREQDRTDG